LTVAELAELLGGTCAGVGGDALVTGFATDNREVHPGDAFLAIRGANVDGHDFVPDAIKRGATVAIVEREVDSPHIRVENLVEALARMGRSLRRRVSGPVVAVTGSVGKTTAKEFIAQALSPLGEVVRTQGNRNTEYTMPLMWADTDASTAAVVVEMAMRGFGQIRHLAGIAEPTVGVITNIGHSHLEMVGDRDGIARAKGELIQALPKDGIVVLWREDDYFPALLAMAGDRPVVTFGTSSEADCRIIDYVPVGWEGSVVKGFYLNLPWEARLPILGRHMALSAAAAIAVAATQGVSPQEAADALADIEMPPMRMEIREYRGATVLMDAYNAAPGSMIAALQTLTETPVEGRRFAILGQMRELGDHAAEAHREIGRAVAAANLAAVCFVGPDMESFAAQAAREAGMSDGQIILAETTQLLGRVGEGDAILIKGSRALELERVLE